MYISIDELEQHIISICSAQAICTIKGDSKEKLVVFKQINSTIRNRAEFILTQSYDQAINKGLLPKESLIEVLKDKGVFSKVDDLRINSLESKIKAQKVVLSKTTKVKARSDRIKTILHNLEKELQSILYDRYLKLSMSADSKAEEDKSAFLCRHSAFDFESNLLLYNCTTSLMAETDSLFKSRLINKFVEFYSGRSAKIIRYIARSNLWRVRYIASMKSTDPLFGIPISEYSVDQLNLIYWSNYYQQIYEMVPEDRPSDEIIDDDDALEAFMEKYTKEINNQSRINKANHRVGGVMSAFDSEEVIVTQSHDLYEDIEYDKPRESAVITRQADFRKRTSKK